MSRTSDADSHYGNPTFSPDGTRIAFTDFALGPDGNPVEPFASSIGTAWVTGRHLKRSPHDEIPISEIEGPAARRVTKV